MTPAQVAHIMALVDEYLYAPLKQKRAAIEAALRDAPQADGWVMVPAEIVDRFPEINTSNYDHDDACALNAWGVELVLAARPSAPTAVEPRPLTADENKVMRDAQWDSVEIVAPGKLEAARNCRHCGGPDDVICAGQCRASKGTPL